MISFAQNICNTMQPDLHLEARLDKPTTWSSRLDEPMTWHHTRTFCSASFVDGFQDLRLLEMFYDRMENMDGNKDGKLNLSSVMSKERLDGTTSLAIFFFGNACGYPERVATFASIPPRSDEKQIPLTKKSFIYPRQKKQQTTQTTNDLNMVSEAVISYTCSDLFSFKTRSFLKDSPRTSIWRLKNSSIPPVKDHMAGRLENLHVHPLSIGNREYIFKLGPVFLAQPCLVYQVLDPFYNCHPG